MDPEKKSLNFIFPTKYVIPKSLKFSHWPSKFLTQPPPPSSSTIFHRKRYLHCHFHRGRHFGGNGEVCWERNWARDFFKDVFLYHEKTIGKLASNQNKQTNKNRPDYMMSISISYIQYDSYDHFWVSFCCTASPGETKKNETSPWLLPWSQIWSRKRDETHDRLMAQDSTSSWWFSKGSFLRVKRSHSLDIQGHLLRFDNLGPKNIPKTPNLRRYPWMSRDSFFFFAIYPHFLIGKSSGSIHSSQISPACELFGAWGCPTWVPDPKRILNSTNPEVQPEIQKSNPPGHPVSLTQGNCTWCLEVSPLIYRDFGTGSWWEPPGARPKYGFFIVSSNLHLPDFVAYLPSLPVGKSVQSSQEINIYHIYISWFFMCMKKHTKPKQETLTESVEVQVSNI